MLVIRLARGGRSKHPIYRIVAAESARAATGKFVEVLGQYNPHTKELTIKKERVEERLSHGAQPSNTVIKLLQKEKVALPAWVQLKTGNRKPKHEPEAAPEEPQAAEAPAPAESTEKAEQAEEKPADTEERVAEAATEAAETAEENAPNPDKTETAEDDEKAAEAVEKAEKAGDAAIEAAKADEAAASDAKS